MSPFRLLRTASILLALAAVPTATAAAQSYHESRQDHLIHVLQGSTSALNTAVKPVTKTATTLASTVGNLNATVNALTGAVTKLQLAAVPEYGIARALLTQGAPGSTPAGLPSIYTPQIPREGIDPAMNSGELVVQCATAPCKVTLVGAVRSPRATPSGGAAQIGGGVVVANATTGAVVAAGNVAADNKHSTVGVVPLRNVGQVPVKSVNNSDLTPVPFDTTSGVGVQPDGSLTLPTVGGYVLHGTFYFYDLDNLLAAARDTARTAHAHQS